jgi:hypothetical protein
MSILHTPTPPYQGQEPGNPEQSSQGFFGWVTSLFRTPTPVYKTAPEPSDGQAQAKAKEPKR